MSGLVRLMSLHGRVLAIAGRTVLSGGDGVLEFHRFDPRSCRTRRAAGFTWRSGQSGTGWTAGTSGAGRAAGA